MTLRPVQAALFDCTEQSDDPPGIALYSHGPETINAALLGDFSSPAEIVRRKEICRMRSRLPIFALFGLLIGTTGARAVDKDKLRRSISLVEITILNTFGFNTRMGFILDGKPTPIPEQIAALQKKLAVDGESAEDDYRLGLLYDKAGNRTKSKELYTKSVELCRCQFKRQPDDLPCRLTLAKALQGLEKLEEAEILLRQLVKEAPCDWRCWLELAECLNVRSYIPIMGDKPFRCNSPRLLLEDIRKAQPTPEGIAAAQPYRKESASCFEKAIALAPQEAKIYQRRLAWRQSLALLDYGLCLYKGEKVDPPEDLFFLSLDSLNDLRRLSDLNKDDYAGIGSIAFYESVRELRQYQKQHPTAEDPGNKLILLSEATRKRILKDFARLEKGMQSQDKHKAADAAVCLGSLRGLILDDPKSAEKCFRRCLELDPTRDAAWEGLIGIMLKNNRDDEIVKLCHQQIKYKDSAHNRLILAKIHEHLGQNDKTEEAVREGLKRYPDDFLFNLAFADLLLRRGDAKELKQAAQILTKLQKERDEGPPSENRWANHCFACGIYFGLTGDENWARRLLEDVRKRRPDYPGIKEALDALSASDAFFSAPSPP